MPHGFDFVKGVFHRRVAEAVEQMHAVDSQHGRQWIGKPTVLALGIITGYLLLQVFPGNHLVHPGGAALSLDCFTLLNPSSRGAQEGFGHQVTS